jgi:hypothetical protein
MNKKGKELVGLLTLGAMMSGQEYRIEPENKEIDPELIAEKNRLQKIRMMRKRGMKYYTMTNGVEGWALNSKNAIRKYGGEVLQEL